MNPHMQLIQDAHKHTSTSLKSLALREIIGKTNHDCPMAFT
jgi:hypothetical protein